MLKRLIFYFKFHTLRIVKWLSILFKRNRKLKKLSFDYYKSWLFDNSYLVVNIKFENAIYYKVGNFKSFNFNKPLILNLKSQNTDMIKVEVYGFFQKQNFIIELNKEIQLNSASFKTNIQNISPIEIIQNPIDLKAPNFWFASIKPKIPNLWLASSKPKITIQNIAVKSNNIIINHKNFNSKNYI